ncbi:methyltransferase domain-containing protein [Desulfovibrio ferrophilus]|uniref:Methyltransferase type 11 n=1 Tax=Desulfovibrio ferrophilus TaxID=241368 RepID=A0A2Z6AXW4_9BACT|nr:methyltransferase domain-containing protein [Desulfovibrio ferrophilus]BBD08058.1 methyltransferase type 11 [Desulfovibrio ferrophilus]
MKKQVATHFSRAGSTYAAAADVQREVAAHCAGLVPVGHYPVAVEIGAGGGLLTQQVRSHATWERYLGLDIARGMLVPSAVSGPGEALIVADGEAAPLREESADLLISASTMQWYASPRISLPANLRMLKPGGRFALCLFVRGTLAELEATSTETGFGSVLEMPDTDLYTSILDAEKGIECSHRVTDYVREYPDARSFLRQLQFTGATCTAGKRAFSRQRWESFRQLYECRYASGCGVRATYRVLFLWGRRA